MDRRGWRDAPPGVCGQHTDKKASIVFRELPKLREAAPH
jgi:hypothetical protein